MIHIFFLVVSLTTGQANIAVSNETYETNEACNAAIAARVEQGNKVLNPTGIFVKAAVCMTEDEFKRKQTEQES